MSAYGQNALNLEDLESRRLFSVGDVYAPPSDPRLTVSLNADWKFSTSAGSSAASTGYDDSNWAGVSLPHTWNAKDAQDGGDNYYRGTGWYRRDVTAPAAADGKRLLLHFDGASLVTSVYIDGHSVGKHSGAYAGFNFDVTDALGDGDSHVLAIQCDNSKSLMNSVGPTDGADFNSDGGLYRGVSLIAVSPTHVTLSDDASAGVFFSTPSVSSTTASIKIKTDVDTESTDSVTVRSVLVDEDGTIVADTKNTQTVTPGDATSITQSADVDHPHLWNGVKDPYLHDLYVEVRDSDTGKLLDLVHQRVGIRSFSIDPSRGFILNGKPYDLHGVMYQADHKNQGLALSDADTRADFQTIKDIGATVVRSHYQLSPLFYDLADAAGIVVLSEVPFNGSLDRSMTVSGDFLGNVEQQMREMIRQNYNRPSIVSWGLYNELTDNAANEKLITSLDAYTKAQDPTRVTTGASWNTSVGTLEKKTDVITFNRYYGWYYGVPTDLGGMLDAAHKAAPNTAIGISEYGSGSFINQHGDLGNVTAKGYWQSEEYQDQLNEQTWPVFDSRDYVWAKIDFQLFDAANDKKTVTPTPGFASTGLITADHATKKDSFYYYQANWSDTPVLYLTSRRWTSRSTATVEVKAYANVDSPKLYLNGTLVGNLVSRGHGVYSLPSVTLARGKNVVTITGTQNGKTYTDSATWTYTGNGGTPPVTTPDPASIAGTVYNDADGDGTRDNGESAIAGDRLFLDADNDGLFDNGETSVVATASGYRFDNLAAGTYVVRRVATNDGRQLTEPSAAAYTFTVKAGQAVTGADFGTKTPATTNPNTARLSGITFNDTNGDGLRNNTETVASGKTIYLDANNNGKFDAGETSVLSASDGSWVFSGLAAGTYHVRRSFPSGYSASTPLIDITLAAAQAVSGLVIGSKSTSTPTNSPTASLSGITFNDANKNGKYDAGDGLLPNITVFLDADNDGVLDAGETRGVTDANGKFAFPKLAAGIYHVRRTLATGQTYTTPSVDVTLTDSHSKTGLSLGTRKA